MDGTKQDALRFLQLPPTPTAPNADSAHKSILSNSIISEAPTATS